MQLIPFHTFQTFSDYQIAKEILEQIEGKSIDVFVDFMGTGGNFIGANVATALMLLKGCYKDKNILVLLPDSGTKYLSTNLWELYT